MFPATSFDVAKLDVRKVTSANVAFAGSNASVLDLSTWNVASLAEADQMFAGMYNLTTIYANDSWNGVTGSMTFFENPLLVGGQGSKWSWNACSGTYARIDGGADNPGYFSVK